MKAGNIVKFHTPYPDENPDQLYVVLEVFDGDKPRAKIEALNTGMNLAPITVVELVDLIIVEVETKDLIGSMVTIYCDDKSHKTGKVISVENEKANLDLNKGEEGVLTNVKLKIIDNQGIEHSGYLSV